MYGERHKEIKHEGLSVSLSLKLTLSTDKLDMIFNGDSYYKYERPLSRPVTLTTPLHLNVFR